MSQGAWLVEWTELERGWGMRPDGCWYFPSEEIAKTRTKEQTRELREEEYKIYKGATPDEYSSAGEPRFVPVSAELAKEIAEKGEVYRRSPEKKVKA